MRFLCFLLLLFIVLPLNGQFIQEKNILLPISVDDYHFGVTPVGKEGLVLFHETKNFANQLKRRWEVSALDSSLNYRWTSAFESNMNYIISSVKPSKEYIYLMFQDTNIPLRDVFFLRFKLEEGDFEFFPIQDLLPKEIIGFEILGNSLFLIGSNDGRPAILRYDYGDPRPEVLKGLYNERNEVLQSSVNNDQDYVQVITKMQPRGRESIILVKQFDHTGELIKNLLVESPKGYHMINATAHTDKGGTTSVLGSFSYKRSNLSNGVFSTVFREGQPNQLYYYNYSDLHNYFNYLGDPKKIEKTKLKSKKRNSGRSVKVNQIPRMLMKNEDELVYVGEVVDISEKYSKAYGFLWQQEVTEYSHAIALGIDEAGKIRWDYSISLNGQTSLTSYQQTYLEYFNNGLILFYSDNFNIRYKIIEDVNNKLDQNQITLNSEKIVVQTEEVEKSGNMLYWYDDVYITFGEISRYTVEQNLNKFFYLNKISLDLDAIQ